MKRLLSLLAVLGLLSGCGGSQDTPEDRVRDLIARGEQAAEARSLDYFKDTLSDDYTDAKGNTRKELLRLLTGYYLRNQSIHLWIRVTDVRVLDAGLAEATFYASMAGSPGDGLEQLLSLRADIYRFDLMIDLNNEQILSAEWRRARGEELVFGGN